MLLMIRNHRGEAVAALRKALVRALGPAADEFPGLAGGDAFDALTDAALRRWQAGVGLLADGVAGPRCQALLGLLPLPRPGYPMQLAAVRPLFPATKPANVERYLPYVEAAMAALQLADRPMLLAALGTIRAETEGFVPISELPSQFNTLPGQPAFSAYEPGTGPGRRVGNTDSGDGARFKGRGFVQLTGRDNYRRYGQKLGLPLLAEPELANAPEVAALLLACFLGDKAEPMRSALAADELRAARRLVNGGSHGLERFADVITKGQAAPQVLAGQTATQAAARGRRKPATPPLTARRDAPDLRDRPYLPPPVNLRDRFPSDTQVRDWLPAYTRAGLILDQGQEGACTGFGLAGVVNYLRWRKAYESEQQPPPHSVSSRMLYTLARRYDEYDGEDYEGSSCRGALKGWFNHGVCDEPDWAYEAGAPRFGYADRAAQTPLGVYFRVALDSITDLQAAIQEVGAVYVSAFTHGGWAGVPRGTRVRTPKGHADLPVIDWDGRVEGINGHAFALVGFNRDGFVIQNSWGPRWGAGGFAVLRYDDWLAHAMDAWVAALGVAGVVAGRVAQPGSHVVAKKGRSSASAATATPSVRPWWDEDQARRHSVVLGDDGRVARYLTEDQSTRTLLHQAASLPDQWFRGAGQAEAKKRLLLYVHGGLNSERAALARARALGRVMAGNGCYPLFVCWRTGLLETFAHLLKGSDSAPKARGLIDRAVEASDALLESTLGRIAARPLWCEMKLNAELAFEPSRGGHHLVKALLTLADGWGEAFELHLVGHSAGALWLGHLLSLLARERPSFAASSLQLYAPACSLAFANRHFATQPALMRTLHLDMLSDAAEREDRVGPYRKSLLYLVSNALEPDRRTPLLGLARAHDPQDNAWEGSSATAEAQRAWRDAAAAAGLGRKGRIQLWDGQRPIAPGQAQRASHGGFDNDLDVVNATLQRITGRRPLAMPAEDLRGF